MRPPRLRVRAKDRTLWKTKCQRVRHPPGKDGQWRVTSGEQGNPKAEVPELPGCAADGKSYKEALAKVEIIIQAWIETAKELGRPILAPRGRLAFA